MQPWCISQITIDFGSIDKQSEAQKNINIKKFLSWNNRNAIAGRFQLEPDSDCEEDDSLIE